MGSLGYSHTIWIQMGTGQRYRHLLIISVTLRACVASMGFVLILVKIANCSCIPGFASVNQEKWSLGCDRKFIAKSCKSKDGSITYTMEPISNSEWQFDNSLSILSLSTKDECRAACLVDCNCEAAMYKDSMCRILNLPLKYGTIVRTK